MSEGLCFSYSLSKRGTQLAYDEPVVGIVTKEHKGVGSVARSRVVCFVHALGTDQEFGIGRILLHLPNQCTVQLAESADTMVASSFSIESMNKVSG